MCVFYIKMLESEFFGFHKVKFHAKSSSSNLDMTVSTIKVELPNFVLK